MPGMMDTVLNVGINDDIVQVMVEKSHNPRWAHDTYRRFIQMFGVVVLKVEGRSYEKIIEQVMDNHCYTSETQFTADDLQQIVTEFKNITPFPQDAWKQLSMTIEAVFHSWKSPRAVKYRAMCELDQNMRVVGPAIVIQNMVHGNVNMHSGTGVYFTRSPEDGECREDVFYGEFLMHAVGSDIGSGTHTPRPLQDAVEEHPMALQHLKEYGQQLEGRYKDMLEIEFTIESGELFLLQCSAAKRTPRAAVNAAVAMATEKILSEREALMRVDPPLMEYFQHLVVDTDYVTAESGFLISQLIGQGIASAGGAATGQLVFSAEQAVRLAAKGVKCILCRREASTDDIEGLRAAAGVLTNTGGKTSHAAVLMREMGRAAVTGMSQLIVDETNETLANSSCSEVFRTGDVITIDGSSGRVYHGEVPTKPAGRLDFGLQTLLGWADRSKRMEVCALASSYEEAVTAYELKGDGVGLFRTADMFKHKDCLNEFRLFLLSEGRNQRALHLAKVLTVHRTLFEAIFRATHNGSLTVCLLDAPLGTFLPATLKGHFSEEVRRLGGELGVDYDECARRLDKLREGDSLLNAHGSKGSLLWADITTMQAMAFYGAAIATKIDGVNCRAQIAIPGATHEHEADSVTAAILTGTLSVCEEARHVPNYVSCPVGLVIGSLGVFPRGQDETVFGLSKSDSYRIVNPYVQRHVVARDPFEQLDIEVAMLVQMAVRKVRQVRPDMKIHIAGSQCCDPRSVSVLHSLGADSISCAPHKIPVSLVAAAQVAIAESQQQNRRGRKDMLTAGAAMTSDIFKTFFTGREGGSEKEK
eukprot:gene27322-34021_t